MQLQKWTLEDIVQNIGYLYGDEAVEGQKTGLIYGVTLNNLQKIGYSYDDLVRLSTRSISTDIPYVTEYTYLEGATPNTTTMLVKTIKNGNDIYEYTYDALGNIITVSKNGGIPEQYSYDELNQLSTVVSGDDVYQYSYDNGGNITEVKKNNEVIKLYAYENSEWKDLLTSYNGETIVYDEIGNPLSYRNSTSFIWQNGRQLTNVYRDETPIASYIYNADGLRTSKSVYDITTEYYWMNGLLHGQKTGDEYLLFLYDETGKAYGFVEKNGSAEETYYYEFNLQGDIIGIIDSTGTKVVEYTYDVWGNILSVTGTLADTIGQKNPLRYRGYYYDDETGFYYVSSRYYDPEIGRWINADGYVSTGQGVLGTNMFAYCGNNPVNRVDPTGQFGKELWDAFTQTIQQASGYFAVAAGVSQVDTPAPGPADVVSGVLLLGGVLVCAGIATYTAITAPTPSLSIPKVEEKAEAIPTTPPTPTVIYRYGGTYPGNLTPKAKDKYTGLSFSTVPMPGAAVTTIEALNATGVVYAVQDGLTHVSVRPVGATMEDWINAGSGSIWTQAVKSVVIKWDGGY